MFSLYKNSVNCYRVAEGNAQIYTEHFSDGDNWNFSLVATFATEEEAITAQYSANKAEMGRLCSK